jgi:hypothetical protein
LLDGLAEDLTCAAMFVLCLYLHAYQAEYVIGIQRTETQLVQERCILKASRDEKGRVSLIARVSIF